MGKKVYTIENEDLSYISEVNGNIINMRRSKSDSWSSHVQGEHIGSIKDSGDGVKVKLGKKTINLDYSELVELMCMLEVKTLVENNLRDDVEHLVENK